MLLPGLKNFAASITGPEDKRNWALVAALWVAAHWYAPRGVPPLERGRMKMERGRIKEAHLPEWPLRRLVSTLPSGSSAAELYPHLLRLLRASRTLLKDFHGAPPQKLSLAAVWGEDIPDICGAVHYWPRPASRVRQAEAHAAAKEARYALPPDRFLERMGCYWDKGNNLHPDLFCGIDGPEPVHTRQRIDLPDLTTAG